MSANATEPPNPEVTFTVSAVARRLGVAPDTLRTWARRYGLGASEHQAGCHRRYTQADLDRLERMRLLVNQGVQPAEAARIALSASADQVITKLSLVREPIAQSDSAAGPQGDVRGLIRAVETLDGAECHRLITAALDHHGAIATWDELLRPTLKHFGDGWESSQVGVEFEHLLSEAVTFSLNLHIGKRLQRRNHRPVLFAGAPSEMHVLPLLATAAAAAEQQVECRLLGGMVPHESLVASIERTGPAAVMLWAQTEAAGEPIRLASLPALRPSYRLLLGGPGWPATVPGGAVRVQSISHALSELVAATR